VARCSGPRVCRAISRFIFDINSRLMQAVGSEMAGRQRERNGSVSLIEENGGKMVTELANSRGRRLTRGERESPSYTPALLKKGSLFPNSNALVSREISKQRPTGITPRRWLLKSNLRLAYPAINAKSWVPRPWGCADPLDFFFCAGIEKWAGRRRHFSASSWAIKARQTKADLAGPYSGRNAASRFRPTRCSDVQIKTAGMNTSGSTSICCTSLALY